MEPPDTLSLAVFMPNCQFLVVIDRSQIKSTLEEIEEALKEQNIGPDQDTINFEVMKNAHDFSLLMKDDDVDAEEAVSTIAYSFLYIYACSTKHVSDSIIGILAIFTEESVNFSAFKDLDIFYKNVDITRKLYESVMGDSMIDKTPAKPTLH